MTDAGHQSLLNVNIIHNRPECWACHGSEAENLGLLMVEAPLTHLQTQLAASVRSIALLGLGTLLLLIGAIVPVLRRSILKPLHELGKGVAEISSGNLDYCVPVTGPDELARLAYRFDVMRRELKTSRADMQRRNRELALLNEIALASSQLLDVQAILDFALDTVVNRLRMQAGAIYLLDQDGEYTSRQACACALNPECQGASRAGGVTSEPVSGAPAGTSAECTCPHVFQCQAVADCSRLGTQRMVADPSVARDEGWRRSDRIFLTDLGANERVDTCWDECSGHFYVNVPLRSTGTIRRPQAIVGTMALVTHAGQRLTQRDVDVLRAVGHEIGIAISNAGFSTWMSG